ncbi:MAG: hypothetical protein Q9169_006394 [Polycauliona sp. 2 TL-2023]
MESLSPELLHLVLSMLREGGRPIDDLKAISLVSRTFNEIAAGLLFQRVVIPLARPPKKSTRGHILDFLSDAGILSFNNIYDSGMRDIDCERTVISEVLRAVEDYGGNLDISVRVPWLEPQTAHSRALEALTCLTRLEICMRPTPRPPIALFKRDLKHDYMEILAAVLHKNPRIETFHLASSLRGARGQLGYDKYHNVPLINHSCLREMNILHFEGDLGFEIDDWVRWDAYVDWTKLRTLRIICLPLILQSLSHCLHRLPNLHTLQMRMHGKHVEQESLVPLLDDPTCTAIGNFLSLITVKELDLADFTRDLPIKEILRGSGAKLHRLRLHVNLQKQTWSPREPGQPAGSVPEVDSTPASSLYWGETAFLSSEKLDYLNTTCPYLNHLGLDTDDTFSFESLLQSLSAFRKLRCLQIFYHRDPQHPELSTEAIVKIFQHLRRIKRGVPLECLTFQQKYDRPWYVLWEMGDKIHLSGKSIKFEFELKEIWKHGTLEQKQEFPRPFDQYRTYCEQAAPFGFTDYL